MTPGWGKWDEAQWWKGQRKPKKSRPFVWCECGNWLYCHKYKAGATCGKCKRLFPEPEPGLY